MSETSFSVKKIFLDFVFQKSCAVCETPGSNLCGDCVQTLGRARLRCLRCGSHNPFGQYCSSCVKPDFPDEIVCSLEYRGTIRDLIHQFKFEDASSLAREFGQLLAHKIKKISGFKQFVLAPIPLHKKRLAQRGYNQAELLAREIARLLGMEERDLLLKRPTRTSQVEAKTKEQRRKNIKGAFQINPKTAIPEKVILVDDVITSGATVEEATKVLKGAGVKVVIAAALAMG